MTTLADQCVASASNFAVGIIVARISGPAGLGAFALAYAGWILLTLIHRSLITDPMVILGDLRGDQKDEIIRRGFAADVTFGAMAACITAAVGTTLLVVGQHTFAVGLLSVAPWMLVLILQDYWRQIGFMQGTPKKSLMNDLLFNTVQALGFATVFLAGLHSVFAVISAWGLGAAVAALYGLRQFSVRPSRTRGSGISLVPLANESVVGRRANGFLGGQPALSDPGRRAVGPGCPRRLESGAGTDGGADRCVHQCRGSFGFPEASRQLAERGRTGLVRVSRLVTGAGVLISGACATVVLVAAPTLLKLLYGAQFVAYAPAARVYAVSVVIAAFTTRSGSHPLDHTPIARTLHGLVADGDSLSRGRMFTGQRLRGNRGSVSGFAHEYRHPCRDAGLAVVGSSIARGSAATPNHRFLGSPATTGREKFRLSSHSMVVSSPGPGRGNVADLGVRPWRSNTAGSAPDVAHDVQDYSRALSDRD